MYYPPSYLWHFLLQISIFLYNFYSGVLWKRIFADREKNPQKSQKLEPAKI